MKKTLLISGVLLALTATVASAAGINLSWTDCGANGQQNRNFACASNSGSNVLCFSYDPAGLTLSAISGINTILDLQTLNTINAGASWWDLFNPGSCRSTQPTVNIVFPSGLCADYFQGGGAGGMTAYINTGPNRRRVGGSWSQSEANLAGTSGETYAINTVISNVATVGVCNPGCAEAACLVFNEILISQPVGTPGESPVINTPQDRNWVTWQGGQIAAPGCPLATPAVNRTWGQVKSIYR